MKTRIPALMLILLLVVSVSSWTTAQDVSGTPAEICDAATPAADPETRDFDQPEQVLEAGVDYRAVLCTGAGAVYVDLFEDYAPLTVNNFVFLAQNNFYNNTNFHRVIEDFMAQGGDPTNTGSGGVSYQIPDEYVGFLTFDAPGLLATANRNNPQQGVTDTNGSQFFITTAVTDWLNFNHTIFGEVLAGQENVDAIELRDPQTAEGDGTALDTIVIITDPANVTADVEDLEQATQANVEAAFEEVTTTFADLLGVDEEVSRSFTSEELLATVSEDHQAAFEAFLEETNHDYRVTQTMTNTECNPQIPFTTVTYTVDAYETAEDADAALEDGLLVKLAEARGFENVGTHEDLPFDTFTQSATGCDDAEAIHGLTFFQRGRFVVTTEIVFPQSLLPETIDMSEGVSVLVTQLVNLTVFEPQFSDVYMPELR